MMCVRRDINDYIENGKLFILHISNANRMICRHRIFSLPVSQSLPDHPLEQSHM